jgi:hypothetical protein
MLSVATECSEGSRWTSCSLGCVDVPGARDLKAAPPLPEALHYHSERMGYCEMSGSGPSITSPWTMAWHTSIRS